LPDGTLSGSLLPLNKAIRNLVDEAGIETSLAIRYATLNPARALGLETTHGLVAAGRRADLAVVDDAWDVVATIVDGVLVYRAPTEAPEPAAATGRDA
jgi:N-acetylglucosamine-6-phosphate deacetylase